MSLRERDRLEVLSRVKRKELSLGEAAEELGVSYRQARRVYKRFGARMIDTLTAALNPSRPATAKATSATAGTR